MLTMLSGGGNSDDSSIVALDLQTGARHLIARGGVHGRVSGTDLIYGSNGTLHALVFDPSLSPSPAILCQCFSRWSRSPQGRRISPWRATERWSTSGGTVQAPAMTIAWRDRQGHEEAIPAPPRAYTHVRVSPDGQRVALDLRDQDNDIWIWDTAKQTLSRFTFNPGLDENPVWAADGKRIAFSTMRQGTASVYWQAADGTGVAERLSATGNFQLPWSFTPDSRSLVVRINDIKTGIDLGVLNVDGKGAITPLVELPGTRRTPTCRLTASGSHTSRTNRDGTKSTCGRSHRSIQGAGRSRAREARGPSGRETGVRSSFWMNRCGWWPCRFKPARLSTAATPPSCSSCRYSDGDRSHV